MPCGRSWNRSAQSTGRTGSAVRPCGVRAGSCRLSPPGTGAGGVRSGWPLRSGWPPRFAWSVRLADPAVEEPRVRGTAVARLVAADVALPDAVEAPRDGVDAPRDGVDAPPIDVDVLLTDTDVDGPPTDVPVAGRGDGALTGAPVTGAPSDRTTGWAEVVAEMAAGCAVPDGPAVPDASTACAGAGPESIDSTR